jgi:hypothetical protein
MARGGNRTNSGRKAIKPTVKKPQVKKVKESNVVSVTTRMKKQSNKESNVVSVTGFIELPIATLEQLDTLRGDKSRVEYLVQQLNLDFLEQQRIKQFKVLPQAATPVEDLGINPHLKRNLAALEKAYGRS